MSRHRRRSPQIESLEGKLLLSTVHPMGRPQATALVLDGNLSSSVKAVKATGTTTLTISEAFTGTSRSLGRVKGTLTEVVDGTTGALLSAGFLLKNAKGSVHLAFGSNDLVAHSSDATTRRETLTYSVDSGTGAYATAAGSGTFTMTYHTNTGAIDLLLHSK